MLEVAINQLEEIHRAHLDGKKPEGTLTMEQLMEILIPALRDIRRRLPIQGPLRP